MDHGYIQKEILVLGSMAQACEVVEPEVVQANGLMGRNYDVVMKISFLVGSSGKENFVEHERLYDVVEMKHQMTLVSSFENLHTVALHHLVLYKQIHFLAACKDLYHSL